MKGFVMVDLEKMGKDKNTFLYALRQLGTPDKASLQFIYSIHRKLGWRMIELIKVIEMRTEYLYQIIPCRESQNAIGLMQEAFSLASKYDTCGIVKSRVPGHIYQSFNDKDQPTSEEIKFIRRSGKAITHPEEWSGLQSQEVLRAMIHFVENYKWWDRDGRRTIADLCRKTLWEYEARAYRRKRQELNRESPEHNEKIIFDCDWIDIEQMEIGEDGHIPLIEMEALYLATFGVMDAEQIPGVSPFATECDPVYIRAMEKLGSR